MIIVRYADDLIVGFEHETDARRFLDEMRKRLQEFALSLHSEKTRLIEFGRFAVENRKRRGLGKPETFTFLGFTFICGKTRRSKFQIKRKSRRDRMQAKLQAIKQGTATEHSSAHSPAGKMVAAGRPRLLQLPRGADNSLPGVSRAGPFRTAKGGNLPLAPELWRVCLWSPIAPRHTWRLQPFPAGGVSLSAQQLAGI